MCNELLIGVFYKQFIDVYRMNKMLYLPNTNFGNTVTRYFIDLVVGAQIGPLVSEGWPVLCNQIRIIYHTIC